MSNERDDLRDRLDDVAGELGEPEHIDMTFQVYELVPDEVSADNKGDLLIEQDISFVQRRDE